MKNFYITTPIYYVNDVPHIGHAYTSIASDVLARFKRLQGFNVKFLTGTDEHGQKVEKSALKYGIEPKLFVDKISNIFRNLSKQLNLSNDDFIRTTQERHKETVLTLWKIIDKNGYIYSSTYSGWYSLRDEMFYQESELIDSKAPTGADVEWVEEPSYFFKLSAFQDKLLDFYDKNPEFIWPISRRNEVINFVKSGLNDISISRTSFNWGIKVPNDEKHVIYVWLDALTNYISALDYSKENQNYNNFWPADVHVIGKDILRFHAVYWPAFLMAAKLELPKQILAHGWWTVDGNKISKSLGNVIDPIKLIEEFGVDQIRYFLLREIPFGNDGNYSRAALINRINSDLVNNIGNLVQRTLTMVYKNCNGQIPTLHDPELGNNLNKLANLTIEKVINHVDRKEFHLCLEAIINLSTQANVFIDQQAPWKLAQSDINKMESVLYILIDKIRYIGILLLAFVPDSANKILDLISIQNDQRNLENLKSYFQLEGSITKPEIIFKRI